MGKSFLKNILLFLVIFMAINAIFNAYFGPKEKEEVKNTQGVIWLETTDTEFAQGKKVALDIHNDTAQTLVIPNECPSEPLIVQKYNRSEWVTLESKPDISCEGTSDITIPAGEEQRIIYESWNFALFEEMGRYKITLEIDGKTSESNEFRIEEAGVLRLLWQRMLYQPIYNTLIFISSKLGNNLGFGIIVLTLILRFLLLMPSQRALKQQRRMQLIQPKLDAVKHKHKGDQQKIAQETMALWKEHKVNPFGSCMPLIIQFPILIALFYVVQEGLNPNNIHFLYEPLKSFHLSSLNTNFLGILELTKKNIFWLQLTIGALQFVQMKLSMAKKAGKSEAKGKSEMAAVNNMMIYFMPVMIAVFAASVPAGVGVYWGTSTLFGIGQQLVVNKEVDKSGSQSKVKVKNVKE